jgi:hypothetical protein
VIMVRGLQPEACIAAAIDLARLRLNGSNQIELLEISSLWDVHEMTLIDGTLWLTNISYDATIDFDLRQARLGCRGVRLLYATVLEKRKRYQEQRDDVGGNLVQVLCAADSGYVDPSPITPRRRANQQYPHYPAHARHGVSQHATG